MYFHLPNETNDDIEKPSIYKLYVYGTTVPFMLYFLITTYNFRTESVPVGPKKPRQSNVGKVPKRKRRAPKEATNDTMAKYGKQFCFIIIQLIII